MSIIAKADCVKVISSALRIENWMQTTAKTINGVSVPTSLSLQFWRARYVRTSTPTMHDHASRITHHIETIPRKKYVISARGGPRLVASILTLNLILLSGCGTFDTANVAESPWNRPTREEMADPWSLLPFVLPRAYSVQQEYWRPGDHYP